MAVGQRPTPPLLTCAGDACVKWSIAFLSMLGALFRFQLSIRVENIALRRQLAVYQRTVK
jgi:hypothetical protein